MRKPIFVLLAFILVSAILMPVYADIPTIAWLGTSNNGQVDRYYGPTKLVNAYKEGTTAIAAVTFNDSVQMVDITSHKIVSVSINVTRVYISFGWGLTVNSTQASSTSPVSLSPSEEYTFFINFTVPSAAKVSNLYVYSYTVYATYEYYNVTYHPQTLSGTFSYSRQNFVVYSTDQAAAVDLNKTISSFLSAEPPQALQCDQAKILYDMAANETANGDRYYLEGDFTLANQSYSTALNHLNSALSDEQSYQTTLQGLQTGNTSARNAYFNAWASFLNGFSTLWVLLGIGWVLISIGYIIKVMRTRRPEAPSVAPA